MSEWITARQASSFVNAAGLGERDLIEWARRGRLQARARSGTFSSDDPVEERYFPKEPPLGEVELSTVGPWPDIPIDFWDGTHLKALWGAGTFAARIWYWCDYYQKDAYEHITLFDVTFQAGNLEMLLNGSSPSVAEQQLPKERWRQQRLTPSQAAALEFMEIILTNPPKDPLGPVKLHLKYLEWHKDPKTRRAGDPLKRTAFEKWANRFRNGYRVGKNRRLVHHP